MTRRTLAKATLAALAAAAPATLAGCSQAAGGSATSTASTASSAASAGKNPLTVYLWDTDLVRDLAPYIRQQLPGKDIQFIGGNNDVDLYSYLLEHGELPDIMTVRRFAGTEARDLRSHLLDFDYFDVVTKFSSYSLQYYKGENNQVNWLPVCGIPQTIIANKTLFDEQGLSLPQTYDEYAQVCQALAEKGIKPYALDLAQDYSSHEMVQAGGIGELTSLEGISWRAQAETAQGDIEFDDALWTRIFSQTANMLADSKFTANDLSLDTDAAMAQFVEGKAAMFHGSPIHLKQCKEAMPGKTLVRVPYFSQTSKDGYVYMTPSLQVAVNKDLENDTEKLNTALAVVDCMIDAEGQKLIANGSAVISFNPAVASIIDGLAGLETEVENNQYYIRYSAQKSFSAAVKAVTGLLTQEMDADQAYQAFRTAINSEATATAASVTFDNDYALALNDRCGRDAASAILGTLREELGAQLALAPFYCFTGPIRKGACTEARAKLLVTSVHTPSLYLVNLTGAQVKDLVRQNLAGQTDDFSPASVYELPVASGMKLIVQPADGEEASFDLNDVQVDGASIDDEKTFSVLLAEGIVSGLDNAAASKCDVNLPAAWTRALTSGRQLAEPQDYIEVRG